MLWKNEIRQRKTSSRTLHILYPQRLYEIKILLGRRGKKICLDKDFTNLREVSDLEL